MACKHLSWFLGTGIELRQVLDEQVRVFSNNQDVTKSEMAVVWYTDQTAPEAHYALTTGTTGVYTLILPEGFAGDSRFEKVGDLIRFEADKQVVGYSFDLRTNKLTSETIFNPSAGKGHKFVAYRLAGQGGQSVSMAVLTMATD